MPWKNTVHENFKISINSRRNCFIYCSSFIVCQYFTTALSKHIFISLRVTTNVSNKLLSLTNSTYSLKAVLRQFYSNNLYNVSSFCIRAPPIKTFCCWSIQLQSGAEQNRTRRRQDTHFNSAIMKQKNTGFEV